MKEKGFGMISMMIELGLVSIMILSLTSMSTYASKNQFNMMIASDMMGLVDRVRKNLEFDSNCTPALLSNDIDLGLTIKDPLNTSKMIAQEGAVMNPGNWKITQLRLTNITDMAGQAKVKRGTLVMEITKDITNSLGGPILTKTISDIYFEVGATPSTNRRIQRCYGASNIIASMQSTCEMMGGTFFPDHKYGTQCVLTPSPGNDG